MKPPKFEYYDPTTLDEALDLLDRHGDEAKVLAGGQSLVPLMNMRLAKRSYPLAPFRSKTWARRCSGRLAQRKSRMLASRPKTARPTGSA